MELNKSMRNFGCGALPSVKLLAEGKCAVYTVTARYVGFVEPWNGFWGHSLYLCVAFRAAVLGLALIFCRVCLLVEHREKTFRTLGVLWVSGALSGLSLDLVQ